MNQPKYKLFSATITRRIYVIVPDDDDTDVDDVAWSIAEEKTCPDPNDPYMESVSDCDPVESVPFGRDLDCVPLAGQHNAMSVKQLIDAGNLIFKK